MEKRKRIKVGLIFGGKSAEHEISIKSARAIYNNIDDQRFTVQLIYISKDGRWAIADQTFFSGQIHPLPDSRSFLPWEQPHPHIT